MNAFLGFFSKREQTPIESREYGKVYLVLSGLLFLGTMWAVVDEVMTRRPWKDYQRDYYALALSKWQEVRAQAIAAFDSSALADLTARLEELKANQREPEYMNAVREIQAIETELLDVNREFTFAKSRFDEAYYFWKKSVREGKEDLSLRDRVQRLEQQVAEGNAKVEKLESRKAELTKIVNRYDVEVREVRSKIGELYASIDRAQTRIAQMQRSPIAINQVMMNNFDRSNFGIPKARIDRCQTCHLGWNDEMMDGEDVPLVYRRHPLPELLKIHDPEVFGCTPCHHGQGPALTEGFAHGYDDKYWEWPLRKGKEVYASCNDCHSSELYVRYGEPINKAKTILVESGCHGCHEMKGYTELPKIGPELNQLPAKTNPEWLFRWVRNPKDYSAHTRMPNFRFDDDQAEAITAYLWKIGQESPSRPNNRVSQGGMASRGKVIVETVGCIGCHVVGNDTRIREARGLSYDIAPELSRVGSKVDPDWLYEWLKNPRHYRPDTRMPSLQLTDQEARDVVAYLMTLKDTRRFEQKQLRLDSPEIVMRGEKLIREFGCHGCHAIKGMEKEGRVSVSLSNIGRKRVDELDFGDTKIPRTWDDWVFNKIKDAQVFATDRIESKMPVFALTDDEVVLLRTLLRSFTREKPEPEYHKPFDKRQQSIEAGRMLALDYNCIACHQIEETGGFIKATLEDEGLAPPTLRPQGAKVQEPWMYDFLKEPKTIRPWLKVRMPTFSLTDEEITIFTNYFLALHDKELKLRDYTEMKLDPKLLAAGKKLYDDFQCALCHQAAAAATREPADLAPDLSLARQRLKPEWIIEWLSDPQKIQPGTRMPTYFPDMQTFETEVLGGDVHAQIQALRDYVMSLGKPKSASR